MNLLDKEHTLRSIFPAYSESACNAGGLGSILGMGRSPGEGNGYPLQYSGLENSMDYTVHEVTKSQTQLSNFPFFPSTQSRYMTSRNIISHWF